jgi:MATE family multidrug resistance protein
MVGQGQGLRPAASASVAARHQTALPAQRLDRAGRAHISQLAILALAVPLMANSAVQIVLNLTDMWFVGRIATRALAAVGAVQWLVLVVVYIFGGVGQAVQTLVAQAQGAHRYRRAGQAAWLALWGTALAAPLFIAVGAAGHAILSPFGLQPEVAALAASFWYPRVAGACFGAAVWAMFGFFNGVGRPRTTLLITCVIALSNALLNQLFIFELGWGIVGSAWATTLAQALGLLLAIGILLGRRYRRSHCTHLTWRPQWQPLLGQMRLGLPMGVLSAADLFGYAMFQIMQVRLGVVGGAASQIVMMLTSVAYMPGYGIAAAGTTLVGQSIGAGATTWAARLGNRVILLTALYMGAIGVVLALAGPWILPLFTGAHDAEAAAAVSLGARLLWVAACYQFFDGMSLGSSLCLRGAGDAVVPMVLVLGMSWLLFVPLGHALIFAPGQGWVNFLPQWGLGAMGGWIAVLIYILMLGSAMYLRWRSDAWMRIHLR